ncbi:glycosyltransferase family 4 protein [Marinobacter flavimaris]|uniref:Glycosyltransferase family 4 protein n=2 Tax=Marinobacter flavimaris TaxID=262076 RepID=A0A3D8H6U1_9GAMM|nr:glycosyltransferase family 4 protein [Marinobacter flavimaris]RDU42387.1 glycosyltransferase family 4 protein [Marinobacter flavimaris]
MYPSPEAPYFGVFVKNSEEQLLSQGFTVNRVVIKTTGGSIFSKLKEYTKFFFLSFFKLLKSDFDVVYVHYAEHSLLPVCFARPWVKAPLVVNAHGDDILYESIISSLVKDTIKKSDLLVVPSDYFANFARHKYDHENIFVSPSGGIDTRLFRPIDVTNEDRRAFTIGFVSRIDQGKGWDVLLSALRILKSRGRGFNALVIGGGGQIQEFKKRIKGLELQDSVQYLGPKAHRDLPGYFNLMDVFVFPTTLPESLGLVGLEAMACGIPVIGSEIGGLPSYIEDHSNGLLFEPGDQHQLAKCIEFFMDSSELTLGMFKRSALNRSKQFDSKSVEVQMAKKLRDRFQCVD